MPHMNVEQSARAHIGWLQILQMGISALMSLIGGLILMVLSNIYSAQTEAKNAATALSTDLAVMKNSFIGLQAQLSAVNQIPAALARIETKLDEHERRIHEIEQLRRLK